MAVDQRLPWDAEESGVLSRLDARDREGRARAVDPRDNVALEASAGTGKTRVLVQRYVNLLHAGVDPANILAMTFTRKAAAEMRERILSSLRDAAAQGTLPASRWRVLRDRVGDIAISTIDAFCLSLLREFPLEADLDPGFTVADETDVPRLMDEALDRALRICRSLAREDEHVALVFAQLGARRARGGLAALLARRLVAPDLLAGYVRRQRPDLTVASAAAGAARALLRALDADVYASAGPAGVSPDGAGLSLAEPIAAARDPLLALVESGPADPAFALLVGELERLAAALREGRAPDPAHVQAAYVRARAYFLTQDGRPRTRPAVPRRAFVSDRHWKAHRELVARCAPQVVAATAAYRRDLNALVSRGVWRMFRVAESEYRRTLDAHAAVDFPDLLLRTIDLLKQMEEFARSRYRLESRYHHVLIDEFQDTSRAQWELISLLVQAWGEGAGLAGSGPLPPSIFIVGDRKQSIYGFRDADISIMDEAARYIGQLRPGRDVRRSIARSFRSAPALLAFVNDVCRDLPKARERADAFRYDEQDWFPIDEQVDTRSEALHVVAAVDSEACAEIVSREIAQLLEEGTTVRDVVTGVPRAARPSDIAILFRTRESHRHVVRALERRRIPSSVYKGLGFYDAGEVRDVLALLWYLAEPSSDTRAAAWLASGFVRLSDEGLRRLAPGIARALAGHPPAVPLDAEDAEAFALARTAAARWLPLVDRMPAAELLDRALSESAYAASLEERRVPQARENLKKLRALVRRMENRGFVTLSRIVSDLERLSRTDDATPSVEAGDSVHLMTVHAAKGLEFPIVFVAGLERGTGGRADPIRVADRAGEVAISVGDFESDSDEDRTAREQEETKRLLYVALTRARDRLYLAVTVEDGQVRPGRGSLAEVMPSSLLHTLPLNGESVVWRAQSGGRHRLRKCQMPRPEEAVGPAGVNLQPAVPESANMPADPAADFSPLLSTVPAEDPALESALQSYSRLRGTLVHRLVQRLGIAPPAACMEVEVLTRLAAELASPDERVDAGDFDTVCADAARSFLALVSRDDVRELYRLGTPFHEVPYCVRTGNLVMRGTLDLLIRWSDGARSRCAIVEFKTGRPRGEDRAQAAAYQEAVEALFPGDAADVKLVYLDG